MSKFAKAIKTNRIKQGLKQEEIAKEVFITQQHYSNIENAKSACDIELAIKLSKVLGVDLNGLLNEKK